MDTYSNKEKYYIILTLHIHISGKSVKSAFMKKVCVHLMNSLSSQSLLQVLNINHSCLREIREIRLFRHFLCSLYEFHQQSSLDTIFLMSNIFSAHTEKTDFSDFRVIRAMRCNTLAKSQLFFKERKGRISRKYEHHML